MVHKLSRKKFYNKFDHKITLSMDGCSILRYNSPEDAIEMLSNGEFPNFYLSYENKLLIIKNKDVLIRFCEILLQSEQSTWKKRIERSYIDIYTTDYELIERLKINFSDLVKTIYKPGQLSVDPYTIRVKKLPHDRYNYRVFLQPHKLKNDIAAKTQYVEWIKGQKEKIRLTESVENWFIKTDWNWDPRYILVDEEATLLMLKLRSPELVGRIYKFVF